MPISEDVLRLLRTKNGTTRIAVVGASNHPEKYGNIITRDLTRRGYTVLPVNPHEPTIAGLTAYGDVRAAPPPVHIVDFVVPPPVSLLILSELDPARTPIVWFQPGSFDDEVVAAAKARFPHVVAGDCIMVVA